MDWVLSQQGMYEGLIEAGNRLAELPEAQGGWREYFNEDEGLGISDPITRSFTALMLENAKRWVGRLCKGRLNESGQTVINEATRSALVGGFSDYLFPIIRAAFPTNPINDLVSVQPTNRRTATVVYWNWVYASNKGEYYKGQRMFDAITGKQDSGFHYSDNTIQNEAVSGALSGGSTVIDLVLAWNDGGGIIPGTVAIALTTAAGADTFVDNAQGEFTSIGTTTVASSSINYTTGAVQITVGATTFTVGTGTATYKWDSESGTLPEVDVQITTSTVETERRGLKVNYSIEAMQDVMAEFGVSLEPQLVSGAAEQLNFEIARQIVAELWAVAPVVTSFNKSLPTSPGYNREAHFRDLLFFLNTASNNIWSRTQKAYGNWMVVDENASSVIESMSGDIWKAAPKPSNVQGLHYIGTLNNKWRVYKDLHLVNLPGSSADGNILMGYKGNQFFEAGFVWSPYQLLYTTDTLTTADFMSQKGMASRYATKMVNPNMYCRVNLTS